MKPRVRTREPLRAQGVIRFEVPEEALPEAHPARVLWRLVETLDLSKFVAGAKAVEGRMGRASAQARPLLRFGGKPRFMPVVSRRGYT